VRITVSPGPASEITVTDRGLGIPEAHRERVFERFYRVDHAELPHQAGTGLGLAISRELAERHGGTLELLQSDIGSCFRLLLPPLPDEEGGGDERNRRD
jgi:signal transduction histidine kinase